MQQRLTENGVLREIKNYLNGAKTQSQCSAGTSSELFERFTTEQDQFARKRSRKIELLRRQKEQAEDLELTLRPRINTDSQKYSREEVFKRLLSSKPVKKIEQSETFAPKILSKSKKLVKEQRGPQCLYEIAVRRQQHQRTREQASQQSQEKTSLNRSSYYYSQKKVMRAFYEQCYSLGLGQECTAVDCLSILQGMGYVGSKVTAETAGMVRRMEEMLTHQGDAIETESLLNLLIALQFATEEIAPGSEPLGQLQNGVWQCTEAEFGKVRALFKPMLICRLHSCNQNRQDKRQPSLPTPAISLRSKRLAKSRDRKVQDLASKLGLVEEGKELSRQEQLMIEGTINRAEKELLRRAKEQEQEKECTFCPSSSGQKKLAEWNFLNRAEPKSKPVEQPKVEVQPKVEAEEQCSFRPEIHPCPPSFRPRDPTEWELLHVMRAEQGRSMRQHQATQLREYRPARAERIEFCVRVGPEREQKLVFEPGDSVGQVASRFADRFGLSREMREKLVRMLTERVNSSES